MPFIIVLLLLIGLAGGIDSIDQANSDPEGEVIVSTVTGGLSRNEAEPDSSRVVTESRREVEEKELPRLEPVLDTLSAQNIDTNKATLRGNLTFPGQSYRGRAFFLYSRNFSAVESQSDEANERVITNSASKSQVYTRSLTGLSDDTEYHYRLCFEEATVVCGDIVSFTTVEDFDRNDSYRLPSVSTQPAVDIQADVATLEGTYRRNDAANTTAFFVYGQNEPLVKEIDETYDEYRDIEEQDEDLQKKRVEVNIADRGSYSREIDDLERDTEYFFSLCIAYDDDEATGIKCGSTRSFDTKSRNRDVPSFRSISAVVTGTSARISGILSMEDYLDGHAFLVYGIDEERIQSVTNYDRFSRVTQSGDDIQKVSLETDFDGTDSFSTTVSDLVEANTYYYRFCIEYEGEDDRGKDDEMLACDDVDSFVTQ